MSERIGVVVALVLIWMAPLLMAGATLTLRAQHSEQEMLAWVVTVVFAGVALWVSVDAYIHRSWWF